MPLCVFDISDDGTTTVPEDTQLTGPARYRWWHFDMADPALAPWLAEHLPEIPAGALLQPETRPRCDEYEDGLILNLRGINLNEGQQADQMVSVRMWVTDAVVITVRMRRVFAIDELRALAAQSNAPPRPSAFLEALVSRLTARLSTKPTSKTSAPRRPKTCPSPAAARSNSNATSPRSAARWNGWRT